MKRGRIGQLAFGAFLATIYAALATFTFRSHLLPRKVLLDGLSPPPPYRWIDPPPDLAATNELPAAGEKAVILGPEGSQADSIATSDAQAVITLPSSAFAIIAGESQVSVTITPVDPAKVVKDANGIQITGNAYRFEAFYALSHKSAKLKRSATISLRYPLFSHYVFRESEDKWQMIPTNVASGIFAVYADSDQLGVFAAGDSAPKKDYRPYIAISAAVVVVAGLIIYSRRRRLISKKKQASNKPQVRRKQT